MKKKRYISPIQAEQNNIIRRRAFHLGKWVLYVVLLFFSFAFMMTPGLPNINGAEPLLIIPLVIAVCVFEGEMAGGFFAIVAGLVWASGSSIFWGFDPIILYFCTVICGLIVRFYLRDNLLNTLVLVAFTTAVYLACSYFVLYGMWDYPGASAVFFKTYVPTFFLTLAFAPFYYFLVKLIYHFVKNRAGTQFWAK